MARIKYWNKDKNDWDYADCVGSVAAPLQPLTFTGASTGEYDGTEALEINIPTVQDVIDALPKWTGGAF